MGEADTMRSVVIAQVMQNAESYHDIRISESRVVPKRLRVADHESSLASVGAFGGSNISTIDIEFEVLDVRELWEYLCRPHPISMTLSPVLA